MVSKSIVDKQGLELELLVFDKDLDKVSASQATEKFRHSFRGFKVDDDKPEFPSTPCNSLGDLSDHVQDVMSKVSETCKSNNWLLLTKGCHPNHDDFASGHIHNSILKVPDGSTKNKVIYMRKKLFNAQPLIAAISQNSPIWNLKPDVYKDARLAHSNWSTFTEYDSTTTGHYIALAYGMSGATLEVRLPSCGALHQMLGVAAIIRTILEMKETLPVEYTKESFRRVLKWGAQALIPINIPSSISYFGVSNKSFDIPLYMLFKAFIGDGETADILNDILSTVPAKVRMKIEEFYNMICKGYTVSDCLLNSWRNIGNKDKFYETVDSISRESYRNNTFLTKIIDMPSRIELPKVNTKIDFGTLQSEIEKVSNRSKSMYRTRLLKIDFEDVLYSSSGILQNVDSINVILSLITMLKMNRVRATDLYLELPSNMKSILSDNNVISYHNGVCEEGSNLSFFMQTLEREGFIT